MSANESKLDALRSTIRSMDSAAVALSGGADSALVAKIAKDELGDRSIAVTIDSPLVPRSELAWARKIAKAVGIEHRMVHLNLLEMPSFAGNPANRCYLCKRACMEAIREIAEGRGMAEVLDGSNYDDRERHRPGSRAISEAGVRSPLSEVKMTEQDVRRISRRLHLPTHSKSSSPCLATRIPYGDRLTVERLARIEKAEKYLASKGFDQIRVRDHGDTARIEVRRDQVSELSRAGVREAVVRRFKALGYSYVTLDMQGYRTGSLDEVLKR